MIYNRDMTPVKPLSIIVPVYNVERYIGKCIDSLIQTEGIEQTTIILVDDGSTDDSGKIADAYASTYDYILCYQLNHDMFALLILTIWLFQQQ